MKDISSYIEPALKYRGKYLHFITDRKPSAQITKLLPPGHERNFISKLITDAQNVWRKENTSLYYISVLVFNYGLRISEVLNVRYSDFRSNNILVIQGSKGSHNRLIQSDELAKYYGQQQKNTNKIFWCYSRFYVYREFVNKGLSFRFGDNKVNSVTHSGRHLLMLNLKQSGIELEDIQSYIGHKNIKNTKIYAEEKTKKDT